MRPTRYSTIATVTALSLLLEAGSSMAAKKKRAEPDDDTEEEAPPPKRAKKQRADAVPTGMGANASLGYTAGFTDSPFYGVHAAGEITYDSPGIFGGLATQVWLGRETQGATGQALSLSALLGYQAACGPLLCRASLELGALYRKVEADSGLGYSVSASDTTLATSLRGVILYPGDPASPVRVGADLRMTALPKYSTDVWSIGAGLVLATTF